jgi:hypothetical protein
MQMTECFKSSSREMQQRMTFQSPNLVSAQEDTSAMDDLCAGDESASDLHAIPSPSWWSQLEPMHPTSTLSALHTRLYSAVERDIVLAVVVTMYVISTLFALFASFGLVMCCCLLCTR